MEVTKKTLLLNKNSIRNKYKQIRESICTNLLNDTQKIDEIEMKFVNNLMKLPIFKHIMKVKNIPDSKVENENKVYINLFNLYQKIKLYY